MQRIIAYYLTVREIMKKAHYILFVSDQKRSKEFYSLLLNKDPQIDVPGMTEFALTHGAVLGLMPETSIKRILGEKIQNHSLSNQIARSELYLLLNNPKDVLQRAILAGATLLSQFEKRDWGHSAGYVRDPDGHILAIASEY